MFGVVSYSGDQDAKVPLTQTRLITNNLAKDLKLVPFTKYGTWYDKEQVCKPPNTSNTTGHIQSMACDSGANMLAFGGLEPKGD